MAVMKGSKGSIPFLCPMVGWIGSGKSNQLCLCNASLLFQKLTLSVQPMTRDNIIKYTSFSSKTTWAKQKAPDSNKHRKRYY